MNRTEPPCCSCVLSGACACVGVVKGTVLCADPWGQPYVSVLVWFWEYVPRCLATGWTWRLATVAALHPWGQEWPWSKKDPHGGQSHCIWLPLTVHSCNPQPTTEHIHAPSSCTGQAHTAGCCFSWIILLLPYLTASGPCLKRDSESWHPPPLCVPLMKVHASSALRELSKCGGITTKQPSGSHHLLSAANCNYSSGYGTDRHSFPPAKHLPFGKWIELP